LDSQGIRNLYGVPESCDKREKTRQYKRRYRQRVKENPEWYQLYKERQRMHNKRYNEKLKVLQQFKRR